MQRITNSTDLQQSFICKWNTVADKIKAQACIEAKSSLKIRKTIEEESCISGNFLGRFACAYKRFPNFFSFLIVIEILDVLRRLALMLPDAKVKANADTVILFAEVK